MTAVAVAVNVTPVAPAPAATLAGTVAFALSLRRATVIPPPGAGALNATVQVAVAGALTLAGVHDRPLTVTGATRFVGALTV